MTNISLEEIEQIHAQSSMMDKVARVLYLQGEWKRLDSMAYQLGRLYQMKGYFTPEEMTCACHILEMIDAVQSEGQRLRSEFTNEWWNEWQKEVLKLL